MNLIGGFALFFWTHFRGLNFTCLGGREDEFVDRIIVADLNRSDLHWLASLPCVKDGQLSIVTAPDQSVGVLGIVFQTQHGRRGTKSVLRFIRIFWRGKKKVTAQEK